MFPISDCDVTVILHSEINSSVTYLKPCVICQPSFLLIILNNGSQFFYHGQ